MSDECRNLEIILKNAESDLQKSQDDLKTALVRKERCEMQMRKMQDEMRFETGGRQQTDAAVDLISTIGTGGGSALIVGAFTKSPGAMRTALKRGAVMGHELADAVNTMRDSDLAYLKREQETLIKELKLIENNISFSIRPKIREKQILIEQAQSALAKCR